MGVGVGWKYKRKPRGPVKKKRKAVKRKPATKRKRAQVKADIIEGIFGNVCDPSFDFPCKSETVVNRDGSVDGELFISAIGDPEDVLLHVWDAMGTWFPEGKSIWISIVFWLVAPKWSDSPQIRQYLEEHDNKPPGGVVPVATHYRMKRNPEHPGNFMQQAFDTARFNVLWRLQTEGYNVRDISVRLNWNPDNEKP